MGKKKKIEETQDESDIVNNAVAILEGQFGKGVIKSGVDVIESPKMVIPVGPIIDVGLNGGIPEGSFVLVFGKQKVGKTTVVLQFSANCQKEEYGGRNVYYLNVEGRLKEMNIKGIKNLNPDKFFVIESYRDEDGVSRFLSAEEFLNIAINIIKSDPGCVLIIDSVAALTTMAQQAGNIGDSTKRAAVAGLMSEFCTIISQIVPTNRNIIIAITQIQSNPSGMGKDSKHKGGNAIVFQADVILEALFSEPKKFKDTDAKAYGQIAHFKVNTSALGPPFGKISTHIRYGKGIDNEAEVFELASQCGIITGTGWYTYINNNGEEIKLQGKERFIQYLVENNMIYDELYTKIMEMLVL